MKERLDILVEKAQREKDQYNHQINTIEEEKTEIEIKLLNKLEEINVRQGLKEIQYQNEIQNYKQNLTTKNHTLQKALENEKKKNEVSFALSPNNFFISATKFPSRI